MVEYLFKKIICHPFLDHVPQERTPVHLRASKGSMHPALMEKGRAIPQPHIGPRHHGSPTPNSFKVNIYKLKNLKC